MVSRLPLGVSVLGAVVLWAACSSESAPETPVEPTTPQPGEAPVDGPESEELPAPKGVVGGMPILERPVILGGIENAAVEAAFDTEALKTCNTAGRPGKVLLKFRIDKGGTVVHVEQKSTTLRHEATETCLQAAVKATAFPELERGDSAIVTWPFVL